MPQVQTTQPGHHEGAGRSPDGAPEGLLESSEGIVRLQVGGRDVGTAVNVTKTYYVSDVEDGLSVCWFRYIIDEINFSHAAALLRLNGATLQQLMGTRHLLLGADLRAVYDPRPGIDHVVLAEVREVIDSDDKVVEVPNADLFRLLHDVGA